MTLVLLPDASGPRVAIEATQALEHPRGWGRYTRDLVGALRQRDDAIDYTLFYRRDPAASSDAGVLALAGGRMRLHPVCVGADEYRELEEDCVHSYVDTSIGTDIYHSVTEFPWFTRRARLVVTIHEMTPMLFPSGYAPAFAEEFRKYVQRAANSAAAIVTVSERTASDVIGHLGVDPRRVHVIPNGINDAFLNSPAHEQAEDRYVLYVGAVNKRAKNFAMLAAALPQLPADYRLKIVNGEHTCESLARRFDIDATQAARVDLIADVADDELCRLYRGASLLVFTSYYEGFGFPVLEAAACGCPVLCARNPASQEVAGGLCVFFEAHDERDFRAKLRECLRDYPSHLTRSAREYVKSRMSWTSRAEAYAHVYENVMA